MSCDHPSSFVVCVTADASDFIYYGRGDIRTWPEAARHHLGLFYVGDHHQPNLAKKTRNIDSA
jgi:hypothetical protein